MRNTRRMTITAFLLFVSLQATLWGSSILNFPRVSFDIGSLTGVAFVNPTQAPASVTITAFGADGQLLHGPGFVNPANIEIPAGQQYARLLSELFQGTLPPDATGWMQAVSETDGITGFFLFLNTSVTRFDGAGLPGLGRKILFNNVRQDLDAATELNIFNPASSPVEVTLQLWRPDLAPLTLDSPLSLAAHGMARFRPADSFGLEEVPPGSALAAISTAPIGGFEFVRFIGGDLVGLNARAASETLSTLDFPQMAVLGPWQTTLGVVNYLEQPVILTISARKGDGSLFAAPDLLGDNPITRILGPGETLFEDVGALFGFQGDSALDGWIQVDSTSPAVNGFISYGLPSTGARAAVSTQPTASKRALFSHIATSFGYFTGLALLNPGALTTSFRVLAFTKAGQPLGSFEGLLNPSERISKLITELIPATDGLDAGYFVVLSEQPLYMTSLFGRDSVLANIAPQRSSALEDPGFGGTPAQITPPFAVVQPGGTFQFQATGFPETPDWKIGDTSGGGGPDLGDINPNGLFRAPGASPQKLPVTVSAELTNRVAAASVDVLSKSTLVSGEPQILSVSYLRSLERLYLAELSGQGAASTATRPAQAEPESQVVQALPTPRTSLASFPGEQIAKMIPYPASNGQEYLLLAASTSGRVIRLDPRTGSKFDVATGLDSPSALVLDPVSGNLLIAERDRIVSLSRSAIETGLVAPSASPAEARAAGPSRQIAGGFSQTAGLAVDACSGRIYVSDTQGVVELDRISGERRIIGPFPGEPAQLLSLYRRGLPCPSAFQLLVSQTGNEAPSLFVPELDLIIPWAGDPQTRDLAFLPAGSRFGATESVLLGGAGTASASRVSQVRVAGLYTDSPSNPPQVPSLIDFSDPLGDTLNEGTTGLDAWGVTTFLVSDTTTATSGALVFLQQDTTGNQPAIESGFQLTFRHVVTPAGSGFATDLYGRIDIDIDQDASTGATSAIDRFTRYSSGLGVEYFIDFGGYDPNDETVPLFQLEGPEAVEVTRLRVSFESEPAFGGTLVRIDFRVTDIDTDGLANLAILVESSEVPADVMPNGGFLSSGGSPTQSTASSAGSTVADYGRGAGGWK